MAQKANEAEILARREETLSRIEKESRDILKAHALGSDGGDPHINSIIARVLMHTCEACNALKGGAGY